MVGPAASGEDNSRPGPELPGISTREALEAQVEGQMVVKCPVLADGTVRNCRVLKTLPFLADAVVARLQSLRLRPAKVQGKAVSIDYVFTLRFTLPP